MNRHRDGERPDQRRPAERDRRPAERDREADERTGSPWPPEPVLHDA